MTVLFDFTVQHNGWFHPTFADGGWEDNWNPIATGLMARSLWCSTLNGQPIDQAAGFATGGQESPQLWFNAHRQGTFQGATIPSPFLVTPTTQINTYTRTPSANTAILWRMVGCDVVVDKKQTPTNPSQTPCVADG